MRARIVALCVSMVIVMGTTAVALANFVPARATLPVAAVSPVASSSTASPSTSARPSTTASPKSSAPTASDGRVVHLTFDDGPDPQWTPEILRVLARHHAKATFFMLGQNATSNPALVDQVRHEGHAVGNHTWNHPQLTRLDAAGVRSQLERTSTALGGTDTCTRPPYGATNSSVNAVIEEHGSRSVLWDVDTNDWRRPGSGVIADRVVQGAKPGAVVLMHDGGGDRSQTVGALDDMLRRLTAQGYRFEAMPGC